MTFGKLFDFSQPQFPKLKNDCVCVCVCERERGEERMKRNSVC